MLHAGPDVDSHSIPGSIAGFSPGPVTRVTFAPTEHRRNLFGGLRAPRLSALSAQAGGYVTCIDQQARDRVEAGQVLVELNPRLPQLALNRQLAVEREARTLLADRTVRNIKINAMPVAEAVAKATQVRVRPVLMSTVTTRCGLSPVVFLPGTGAELYRGLGAIVLSGLLVSSLVTLLVLPALLRGGVGGKRGTQCLGRSSGLMLVVDSRLLPGCLRGSETTDN